MNMTMNYAKLGSYLTFFKFRKENIYLNKHICLLINENAQMELYF